MSKSANLPAESFDSNWNDATPTTAAWKQEVNQRLAAHRTRRGTQETAEQRAQEAARPASSRAAEAAARVAARYAKAPSYSQLLAGEARAVVRAAGAAAEAALHAQAAAEAVLAGLESGPMAAERWEPATAPSLRVAAAEATTAGPVASLSRWQDEPPAMAEDPTRETVFESRWEETAPIAPQPSVLDVWSEMRVHPVPEQEQRYSHGYERNGDLAGAGSWDADPLGSATVEPVQHLPANLIEFPRELVATRKARPRLAEGPLYDGSGDDAQLNIFEVDPGMLAPPISLSNAAVAPPEWASIELEAHRGESPELLIQQAYPEQVYADAAGIQAASFVEAAEFPVAAVEEPPAVEALPVLETKRAVVPEMAAAPAVELLVARMSDRLLAAIVDGALVTLAFLAAAVVVIAATAHPPTGRTALMASGCGLMLFGVLYQFLFLSYAEEGTPGMRYARIALCTFDDENPTREQMRMRIPAMAVSLLPAALGLVWALFDRDHLGWHDRLTRTYQRKY